MRISFSSVALGLAGLGVFPGPVRAAEPVAHGKDGAKASKAPGAESALKSFKFDEGLKASLFASEPLLGNPVAFSVDGQGRWYIAETYRQERGVEDNRGHMNWLDSDLAARTVEDRLAMMRKFYPDAEKFAQKFTQFEDRITRVEDTDGDGVADKQTIYADGFRDPLVGTGAGVLAWGNDVWWTCIPGLWRFRDADGDGKAEVQEKLLDGFGVRFAFRGHDMHGLRMGPDGKIYFSIGDRGLHVKTKEGAVVDDPETGSILRCNPDGSGFEVFATGVRNPQELAFDDLGNLFTGDNNSDSGDKARFVHLVEGGDSGWRMAFQYLPDRGPWNRELLWDEKEGHKAKYIIPPIANVGNGPSGLTYNPGTALGERYKGRFFLSDFRGGAGASVVHEIALEPAGAGFKLKERRDFLKGVLTTDGEFGNDGAFYVLDWVESWGGTGKGRIYRLSDPSGNTALQAETRALIAEGMQKRTDAEILEFLGHPDQRVRLLAQFALAAKGPSVSAVFAKVAGDVHKPLLGRLHAIWGLGQLAEKDATILKPLVTLLSDPDPEVRAQAAKVLGERQMAAAAEKLVALLRDPSARTRYFAALSLGKLRYEPAVEALCAVLSENNDADPVLRHGAVMGLAGCATPERLASKAGADSVAVRVGALLALRRQKHPAIAVFLKDKDESVVLEAARAIHDLPIEGALPSLAGLISRADIQSPRVLERVINAHYRLGKADNARALVAFASGPTNPEVSRKDALSVLANWASPSPKDRLLNLWRPLPDRSAADAVASLSPSFAGLLKDAPNGVLEVAALAAAKLSLGSAGESRAPLVSNETVGESARVAALSALSQLKDARLGAASKAALSSKSAKLRNEGLQILAVIDPAAAVQAIGSLIAQGSAMEKQGGLLALTRIQGPESDALQGRLMEDLIAGKAAAEIQLDILEAARKNKAPALQEKVARYEQSFPKDQPLARYLVSLAGGDAARGRKVFREKVEVQCLRCHKCEIGDSQVGPELTKIGASRDRRSLLESIVYPNQQIAPGFGIVSLTLKDGNMVAGRLVSEDPQTLNVESADAQGKLQTATVAVAEIRERFNAPSPMPENLRDQLSPAELRDLVEYLVTRK
jgi:quinoprotein glucose dehydrogenase